ncbi:MAG: ABC transporter permease [Psychroserpens sp.]|nr:ABC transporter permease [Psychroserpens sp.]
MTPYINVIKSVMVYTLKKVLKRPVILTFSFVQPLMWMLFFGFLFQRIAKDNLDHGISYIDFLLPGICCMTVLFGASQSGITIIRDIQTRFFYRVLRTPTNKGALILGKILGDVFRLIVQFSVVCLLGLIIGVSFKINLIGLLLGLVILTFFAFAYTSLSCFIAVKAKEPDIMATFIHVLNMPILFTSTALVPQKQMPNWLSSISEWNPLTITVDCLREGIIKNNIYSESNKLFFVIGLGFCFLFLISRTFRTIKME